MDTWINTLPKGLYLSLSWVAYPLITRGGDGPQDGHYQIWNEVYERADTVQRESQIGPANQTCLEHSRCSSLGAVSLHITLLSYLQLHTLVNSRRSRWLFQPHLSPLILCALIAGNANLERDKRCRTVSDTFKPLASPRRSPAYLLQLHSNYPCWIATPNHTWFWDALPLSPLVSPSHCLVLIEYTDKTEGIRHIHTNKLYILLAGVFMRELCTDLIR